MVTSDSELDDDNRMLRWHCAARELSGGFSRNTPGHEWILAQATPNQNGVDERDGKVYGNR